MRKLVVQQLVALDGAILEQGTPFWDWWIGQSDDDPELDAASLETVARAGTHVMGRHTYESMAAHWPTSDAPAAQPMNEIPKVVFSKTLESANWPETRIARGDLADEIGRLKAENGGDIVAHGGVRFVQSLARLRLVDEYRLFVYPVAVGNGRSVFGGIDALQELRLVSSKAFRSGVVELAYAGGR